MRTILNETGMPRHGQAWVLLTDLDAGGCGVVRGVTAPSELLRDRMRAMGLCEGRRVQVLRRGGRCGRRCGRGCGGRCGRGGRLVVLTMGTRIGLCRSLAAGVVVEPCPAEASAQHQGADA